jgi:hypothetical protein
MASFGRGEADDKESEEGALMEGLLAFDKPTELKRLPAVDEDVDAPTGKEEEGVGTEIDELTARLGVVLRLAGELIG